MAKTRKDSKGRLLRTGEYQRSDGRYEFKFTEDGIRHSVYSFRLTDSDPTPFGKTPAKSLRTLEKEIAERKFQKVTYFESKVTLNDAVDRYFTTITSLRDSTLNNYHYMYDRFVRDSLGTSKLSELRYSDILMYYNSLLDKRDIVVNTLDIIHNVIHPALTMAVRDGIINSNPSDGIIGEIKKKRHWSDPKRHSLTIEQQNALLDFVYSEKKYSRWAAYISLLLGTGLRVGEFVCLRECNLDFKNGMINISHSLSYRKDKDGKCRFHISKVKTAAGKRSIPMLGDVKNILLDLAKNSDCSQVIDGCSGFIIQNKSGGVLNPKDINQAFERIVDAYNKREKKLAAAENREPLLLPHISCHIFRHTFCTRLCEELDKVDVIQKIMGHADIRTTLEIYNEVHDSKKKVAFEALEGRIRVI
ncbi:MAG: site-specific integrase [Ruminococcus sp.]|nr:site-specific integrase [Ruminococcus sp.]MBR1863847.1 site-specific integrase [Ruminococcus sp.]